MHGGDSAIQRDGYVDTKLHMISSTGSSMVPLSADDTTANLSDNHIYRTVTCYLPTTTISEEKEPELVVSYVSADSEYKDHKLYDLCNDKRFELLCPVQRYEHTPVNRIGLVEFYESEFDQVICLWRSKSIELLIERIKSVFRIDPLPVKGYSKASSIVLIGIAVSSSCIV